VGKVVKRIVLTGGPCAGKSSSLEHIELYLKKKGYVVYIVNETATELINSGIKPFGDNAVDMVSFQDIIFQYQIQKEVLVDEVCKKFNDDKEIVILYDRSLMDNKAYINQLDFDKLLLKYNLSEEVILNRYDLVIHLESAANGKWYTKENNKARYEDREIAIEMDDKIYDAWSKHDNLIRVINYENFKDKQDKILEICENTLNKNGVKKLRLVY